MKCIFIYIVTLLDGRHNRKPITPAGIGSLVNEYPESQTGG